MTQSFREFGPGAICLALLAVLSAFANAAPPQPGEGEEAELREAAESYVDALNRGDRRAIARHWTDEGDLVDETGQFFKGRELAANVESERQHKLAVKLESIRFLSSDVAVIEGTSRLEPAPQDKPAAGRYTAVWVKREGQWLLDLVREAPLTYQSPHERLEPLAWMNGEWSATAGEAEIRLACDWSPDGNFLLREIQIRMPDRPSHSISQRIGWDAAAGAIRSWNFDSDGGHSQGLWMLDGKRWKVSSAGVQPDGTPVEGASFYTQANDDEFSWESTGAAAQEAGLRKAAITFRRRMARE